MAFSKITVMGNVGRDAELRYTPSGKAIAEFSVAVSHSKKNAQGEWEDEGTDWFRVSVWGDRAERVVEQATKGAKVLVFGRFKTREYQTKDGRSGMSLDVSADDVVFLDSKSGSTSKPAATRSSEPSSTEDDELPF